MQEKRPANVTALAARARLLGALLSVFSMPCKAATASHGVYEDATSGIRFAIPYAHAEQKNSEQVTNLVNAEGIAPYAQSVAFSGGVYDLDGESFIVVWVKSNETPPTQRDMRDLAALDGPLAPIIKRVRSMAPILRGVPDDFRFDLSTLKGRGSLRTRAQTASGQGGNPAFKSQAMMQLTKNGAAFVGYYYRDDADADLADRIYAGLAPLPGRALRFQDLAPGNLSLTAMIGMVSTALLAVLLFFVKIWVADRMKRAPVRRA